MHVLMERYRSNMSKKLKMRKTKKQKTSKVKVVSTKKGKFQHPKETVSQKVKRYEEELDKDVQRLKQLEQFRSDQYWIKNPKWVKEVGKLVRSGNKLKAIKTIKDYEECSLKKAKNAVDYYIEHEKWPKIFSHKSEYEMAFKEVMGISHAGALKKWEEDPERYYNHYKEHNIPCISIASCEAICEEYIKILLNPK